MIELIERWSTEEGKVLYANVLNAIQKNRSLASVKHLPKYNDRWDLRGFCFPVPEVLQRVQEKDGVIEKFRAYKLKGILLENIDFSYSTFFRTRWEKCIIINSVFCSADFIQSHFYACRFDKVEFSQSDFNSCVLGGAENLDSGSFTNSRFDKCRFKKVYFNFPVIRNCAFHESVLNHTDFNSSRFSDCTFNGALNDVQFRGRPDSETSGAAISPNQVFNEMRNVDFSGAVLHSCNFSNGIDLSRCQFPVSGDYLIIRDKRNEVFRDALLAIDFTWEEPFRSKGMALIADHYLHESKLSQSCEVLYKWSLPNKELSDKFFNVLKASVSKVNNKN